MNHLDLHLFRLRAMAASKPIYTAAAEACNSKPIEMIAATCYALALIETAGIRGDATATLIERKETILNILNEVMDEVHGAGANLIAEEQLEKAFASKQKDKGQ